MDLSSHFTELHLDDEQPRYRSVAPAAWAQWAGSASPEDNDPATDAFKYRCMMGEGWDDEWDLADIQSCVTGTDTAMGMVEEASAAIPHASTKSLALSVSVTPHRIEQRSAAGEEERLCCSLRQFSVHAILTDASTGERAAACDASTRLVASLVFHDTGERVPATNGEAPLSGEIEAKQPSGGECTFRLRAAALSYHHGRRAFSIRVDAEPVTGACFPLFSSCSAPFFSRARLPDQAKPAAHGTMATITGTAPPLFSSSGESLHNTGERPAPTTTFGAMNHFASGPQDSTPRHMMDADAEGSRHELSNLLARHSHDPQSASLVRVLHEQSETLRAVLAEQREILGEFAKLHGGPPDMSPTMRGVHGALPCA